MAVVEMSEGAVDNDVEVGECVQVVTDARSASEMAKPIRSQKSRSPLKLPILTASLFDFFVSLLSFFIQEPQRSALTPSTFQGMMMR